MLHLSPQHNLSCGVVVICISQAKPQSRRYLLFILLDFVQQDTTTHKCCISGGTPEMQHNTTTFGCGVMVLTLRIPMQLSAALV